MKNKGEAVGYLLYMCLGVCVLESNDAVFEFNALDEVGNSYLDSTEVAVDPPSSSLMVDLTRVQGADSKGADFFNWNRVKVRYCDGASFAGEGQNESAGLYFCGRRIWSATMEELMAKGMRNASQALLSGCSAGGLASILHCDQFRDILAESTKVKCLSGAGFFLNTVDASGAHTLRDMFEGVVSSQDVAKNLPSASTDHLDPTSCFFPENVISHVKTPTFLLNAAYDHWQVRNSLCPPSADPSGSWSECKNNIMNCNSSQMQFLQDFRNKMLDAAKVFTTFDQNGLFINSCYTHCQSGRQDIWFADESPIVDNKKIAESIGDWYFNRTKVKAIDCPYPSDNTCHNTVSKRVKIFH